MERLIKLIERTNVGRTYMLISSWRSSSENNKQTTAAQKKEKCQRGRRASHQTNSWWKCQAERKAERKHSLRGIHTHTHTNTHTDSHPYSIGQVRVIDPNCDEIVPKEHFEWVRFSIRKSEVEGGPGKRESKLKVRERAHSSGLSTNVESGLQQTDLV